MRPCGVLWLVALTATGCGVDFAAAPEPTGGPPVSTFAMPCALPGPQCTDIYIVAHEDDDLLFMNPDIVNSIDAGNHVVAIHLTAGDLRGGQAARLVDHPSAQQYWLDRERGSLNAFAFMATDEGATAYEPGTTISAKWTAQTLDLAGVQLTEYDLVQDAQTVSLVYLRLSDLQLENAWLNKPGHGGQLGDPGDGTALPLAAGAVQTVPCSGCPLGTDLPRQTITRDQLDEVLQGLIARFSENASQSSVSFQDASGLYIDTFGTAAPCNPHDSDHGACGYRDYWDHVYGARFALSAALAVQATAGLPLTLREYRDYSTSQEAATLTTCPPRHPWCDSQTTAKTQIMAYYGLFDDGLVDHAGTGFTVTEPSFQRAASAFQHKSYDPTLNKPPTFDDYDANSPRGWESRQVEMLSLRSPTARRGRLTANGSCLGYAALDSTTLTTGTSLRPVECASAPIWELTPAGQLAVPGTDVCVAVVASLDPSAAVVLAPCTPATPATTFALWDTKQIRTAGARCLSMTGAIAAAPCTNPRDTDPRSHRHAQGIPSVDQAWTLID